MSTIIDMQLMRYLNLFEKVTRVRTNFCFKYNETIYFCVPRPMLSRSIGEGARNIRKLSQILAKKIKIVPTPDGIETARDFIQNIIEPVTFKELEFNDQEIIVSANTQNKAALIGRNKKRLLEMQKIIKDFFGKEFRVQ